jgi:sugar lactone lactonase YvrE
MNSVTPKDYSDSLEVVLDLKCEIGEGPIWDTATQTLVFVESFGGTVYRYDPRSGSLREWNVGQPIGVAIPRARGGFAISARDGVLALDEGSGESGLLVPIELDRRGNRMNDAKCDSRGRLWSATFSMKYEPRAGSIYRVDPDLKLSREFEGVYIANGIAWNPDETRMYFVDTSKRGVDVFDYDIERGCASNRRRFADIDRSAGLPDGIAMDAEGCLWVTLYTGGSIRRYSPAGEWIGTITLPMKSVTSCGFGGPGLRDLYITTGTFLPEWVGGSAGPQAGALFRCRPGVAGMPVYPFGG